MPDLSRPGEHLCLAAPGERAHLFACKLRHHWDAMLDPAMRRLIDGPLDLAARTLARTGLSADAITLAGFVVGLAGMVALATQAYMLALGMIIVNRLADGLDGAVARIQGPTDFGSYLDIVTDFMVYSGLVFGFALGRPDEALIAAFLILSFVGSGTSFLAYAILAAKRGVTTELRGKKSWYYAGGLAEGTETVIFLVLMCLFPDAFPWLAGIFGAFCWITTVARSFAARAEFRARPTLERN